MNLPHELQQKAKYEAYMRLQQFDAEDKMFGNIDENYELPVLERNAVHVRFYRYELVPGSATNVRHERYDKFSLQGIELLEEENMARLVTYGWDGVEYLHDPRRDPQPEAPKAKRATKKKA